jgi:hypothetical protein
MTKNDRHLSTEPRKFTGSVCCGAAGRTNIVLGAKLLVFRRPPVGSKNKVNIYAPNTDNHEIGLDQLDDGQSCFACVNSTVNVLLIAREVQAVGSY